MATKIVQPKVKTASGFDDLVMQQAQNATNATNAINATNATNSILNQDRTYSGFTRDSAGVLITDGKSIPQKKLVWSGNVSSTIESTGTGVDILLGQYIEIDPNKRYIIEGYYDSSNQPSGLHTSFIIDNNIKKSYGPTPDTFRRSGPVAYFIMTGIVCPADKSESYEGAALCRGILSSRIDKTNTVIIISLVEAWVIGYVGSKTMKKFWETSSFGVTKIYEVIE